MSKFDFNNFFDSELFNGTKLDPIEKVTPPKAPLLWTPEQLISIDDLIRLDSDDNSCERSIESFGDLIQVNQPLSNPPTPTAVPKPQIITKQMTASEILSKLREFQKPQKQEAQSLNSLQRQISRRVTNNQAALRCRQKHKNLIIKRRTMIEIFERDNPQLKRKLNSLETSLASLRRKLAFYECLVKKKSSHVSC